MTANRNTGLLRRRASSLLGQVTLRGRHLLLIDAAVAALSFTLTLVLRFDAPSPLFTLYLAAFAWFIPVLIVVRVGVFVIFGLYQRVWRYASIDELLGIIGGSVVSSTVAYAILWLALLDAYPGVGVPRSVPIIDTLLTVMFASAWRFSLRFGGARRRGVARDGIERALVVGGGAAALSVIRQLRADPEVSFTPVGVLADDLPARQRLMGVPIFGGLASLGATLSEQRIDVVLLALPSAPGKQIRRLVHEAEKHGARCLTVPSVAEIATGRVAFTTLREIDVEDLLRRAPARIDAESVSASFRGAVVLITGAGGSIGSELARHVLAFEPAHLVLLGRGENSIFEALQSLGSPERTGRPQVTPVILDIRDADRLAKLILEIKPDVVFHAAAHKHVNLMELYPEEAVSTNVFGTQKLLHASLDGGVGRFILISTDKAVNPTSVMGATKRVAELLVQRAARQSGRCYASVRFGNVLSSRGSVVPIFRRQLAAGGPLLVTDPDVSRYFMTIPEAVQLVLQASILAQPADMFVLDMGDPVKIADLANDLAELHGLQVGRDVDIEFIGLRAGEKLTEELVFPDEELARTTHEAILRVRNPAPVPLILDAALTELQVASAAVQRDAIIRGLQDLVPQYRPSEMHSLL